MAEFLTNKYSWADHWLYWWKRVEPERTWTARRRGQPTAGGATRRIRRRIQPTTRWRWTGTKRTGRRRQQQEEEPETREQEEEQEPGEEEPGSRNQHSGEDDEQQQNLQESTFNHNVNMNIFLGRNLHINHGELLEIEKKWLKKPKETVRRLLKTLVGAQRLRGMTLTGRNGKNPVPDPVIDAIVGK